MIGLESRVFRVTDLHFAAYFPRGLNIMNWDEGQLGGERLRGSSLFVRLLQETLADARPKAAYRLWYDTYQYQGPCVICFRKDEMHEGVIIRKSARPPQFPDGSLLDV